MGGENLEVREEWRSDKGAVMNEVIRSKKSRGLLGNVGGSEWKTMQPWCHRQIRVSALLEMDWVQTQGCGFSE